MVDREHSRLSISQQCRLLSVPRSSLYYERSGESEANEALMRRIDAQFLETPFFGSRQMTRWLRRQGSRVSRKRVRRLMRLLGLEACTPKPKTSERCPEHRVYPYLLRGRTIETPGDVWCADVTYIPMRRGFLYLVVVMDWVSRKALSWRLSNTLDPSFCVEALREALGALSGAFDLQHRPRKSVHERGIHPDPSRQGDRDLDGWQRALDGQHLHRAAVAIAEVRVCVPLRV